MHPNPRSSRPGLLAAPGLAAALALLAACSGGSSRLESFEMVDLQAPAMFVHLATGRDRAFLLEIPPSPVNVRFDLTLKDVTERQILDELVAKDASFQHAEPGGVLVFFPAGAAEAASPYSKRIARFSKSGALGDVIAALMQEAGSAVEVQSQTAAGRRPVTAEVEDAVLRDVLAGLAGQAHVGLIVEPGKISVSRVLPPPSQSPQP